MKCLICKREALQKYCEFHEVAYQNVLSKFKDWQQATEVSWKEYLKALMKNAYTGTWVKEVAKQLLNMDG